MFRAYSEGQLFDNRRTDFLKGFSNRGAYSGMFVILKFFEFGKSDCCLPAQVSQVSGGKRTEAKIARAEQLHLGRGIEPRRIWGWLGWWFAAPDRQGQQQDAWAQRMVRERPVKFLRGGLQPVAS